MRNKTYDIINDYLYSHLIELIKEHEIIPTFESNIRYTIKLEIIDFLNAILDLNNFINYDIIYDSLAVHEIPIYEHCLSALDIVNPCNAKRSY